MSRAFESRDTEPAGFQMFRFYLITGRDKGESDLFECSPADRLPADVNRQSFPAFEANRLHHSK